MGRKTGGGEGRPISLSSFDENQMLWFCVTFKFVCFDGIEGKKLADKVVREKGERRSEEHTSELQSQ